MGSVFKLLTGGSVSAWMSPDVGVARRWCRHCRWRDACFFFFAVPLIQLAGYLFFFRSPANAVGGMSSFFSCSSANAVGGMSFFSLLV